MKAQMKSHALLACFAITSLIAAGCTGDDTDTMPPEPTSGAATITLTRNGQPVAGMQTIIQNEADGAELSTDFTDAEGKVTTAEFEGSAVMTVVDGSASAVHLFTMHSIKPLSDVTFELPALNIATVGSLKYNMPSTFAGATDYKVALLTTAGDHSDWYNAPIVPGTEKTMDVPESAPNAVNNKVTLIATASQDLGGSHKKILAYAVLKDVGYTKTGMSPSPALNFGPWQTDLSEVSIRIASFPTDFNPNQAGGGVRQFYRDAFIHANSFAGETTVTTSAPLDFKSQLVPGLSSEYEVVATLTNDSTDAFHALIRHTSSVAPLTTWTPNLVGLPLVTDMERVASSPSVKLRWLQSASAQGIADMALLATSWDVGGTYISWYALAPVEMVDESGSYEFPVLPAAFAGYMPSAGATFYNGVMLYGDYSGLDGFGDFQSGEGFRALNLRLKSGVNADLELSGATGAL